MQLSIRSVMLLFFAGLTLFSCTRPDPVSVVGIETGRLQGIRDGDVTAFKGIPYAASTAGENRWRPPRPVTAWNGIRSAGNYGPFCPQ